jgi:hypothetical protein
MIDRINYAEKESIIIHNIDKLSIIKRLFNSLLFLVIIDLIIYFAMNEVYPNVLNYLLIGILFNNVFVFKNLLKWNKVYIFQIEMLNTNIINIEYLYYNSRRSVQMKIIDFCIEKSILGTRTLNTSLEIWDGVRMLKQYPGTWFSGSEWDNDSIEKVYECLYQISKQDKNQ